MDIYIAKNAGACYGVSRSLDIVLKAANSNKKIATLGHLIHNPLVVEKLKCQYGVKSVTSIDDAIKEGIEVLIIRSHGVPIEIIQDAKNKGIEIIDATCPYVKNVQNTARILASLYPVVVIIGKVGHPEVDSVSSYINYYGSKCYVAETIKQIDKFLDDLKKIKDKVGVVSQTTQSLNVFDDMIKYLKSNNIDIEVENTICVATKKRQQSAVDLAKKVDCMIVVGGHNSSNTNHLADLCKKYCKKVFHIEDICELDFNKLIDTYKLGITAGASTPKNQIEQIVRQLKEKVV